MDLILALCGIFLVLCGSCLLLYLVFRHIIDDIRRSLDAQDVRIQALEKNTDEGSWLREMFASQQREREYHDELDEEL